MSRYFKKYIEVVGGRLEIKAVFQERAEQLLA